MGGISQGGHHRGLRVVLGRHAALPPAHGLAKLPDEAARFGLRGPPLGRRQRPLHVLVKAPLLQGEALPPLSRAVSRVGVVLPDERRLGKVQRVQVLGFVRLPGDLQMLGLLLLFLLPGVQEGVRLGHAVEGVDAGSARARGVSLQPLVDHEALGVERVVVARLEGGQWGLAVGLGVGQLGGGVGGVPGSPVHDLPALHVHVQVIVVQGLAAL